MFQPGYSQYNKHISTFGVAKPKRDRSAEIAQRRVDRQVNRLLDKAEELLAGPNKDGTGWIKGQYSNYNDTAFCSIGAMDKAYDELNLPRDIYLEARARVEAVMGGNIVAKNDARNTTFPQVMMSFDLAKVAGKQLAREV